MEVPDADDMFIGGIMTALPDRVFSETEAVSYALDGLYWVSLYFVATGVITQERMLASLPADRHFAYKVLSEQQAARETVRLKYPFLPGTAARLLPRSPAFSAAQQSLLVPLAQLELHRSTSLVSGDDFTGTATEQTVFEDSLAASYHFTPARRAVPEDSFDEDPQ
jgi:hypothetical protein